MMIGARAHLPQMIPTLIECAWPWLRGYAIIKSPKICSIKTCLA